MSKITNRLRQRVMLKAHQMYRDRRAYVAKCEARGEKPPVPVLTFAQVLRIVWRNLKEALRQRAFQRAAFGESWVRAEAARTAARAPRQVHHGGFERMTA